jgi:hypothetical protein
VESVAFFNLLQHCAVFSECTGSQTWLTNWKSNLATKENKWTFDSAFLLALPLASLTYSVDSQSKTGALSAQEAV